MADNFGGIINAFTRAAFGDTVEVLQQDPSDSLEEFSFWDDDDDFWDEMSKGIDIDKTFAEKYSQQDVVPKQISDEGWFNKFENGNIPAKALVDIGGGNLLREDAAKAFRAMARAAKKDGVPLNVNSAYRSVEEQTSLWVNRFSNPYPVAQPGTSNHGWGIAVDMDPNSWLFQNAGKFGFSTIPNDPVHWEYKGGFSPKKAQPKKQPKKTGRPPTSQKDAPFAASANVISRPGFTSATALPMAMRGMFMPEVVFTDKERKNGAGKVDGGPIPYAPQKYEGWIRAAAKKYGVSVKLIAAVGQVESAWGNNKVSSAGAKGLMQIMPFWYETLSNELGEPFDPMNERHSIFGGAYILGRNLEAGGSPRDALSLYYSGKPYAQSSDGQWYADKVMNLL